MTIFGELFTARLAAGIGLILLAVTLIVAGKSLHPGRLEMCIRDSPRTPMRDVRLDYSKRWQHQHWISLVSAYRGSPYFDHYRSCLLYTSRCV